MRVVSPLEFRSVTSALYALAALGMASVIYVLMWLAGTNPFDYLVSRAQWAIFLIALYFGTVWFALLGITIIATLIIIKSPVFIEGSRLIYLHKWLWSEDLESIQSVSEQPNRGEWPVRGALRLRLTTGKERWMSTTLIKGAQAQIAKTLANFVEEHRPGRVA